MVLAAVGSGVPVNWGIHPNGAGYPGVVLNTIDDLEPTHMRGPDGMSKARVQIDCYGLTYAGAKTTANTIRAALAGAKQGRFQGIFFDGLRDSYDDDKTTPTHRVSMDFMVNYER